MKLKDHIEIIFAAMRKDEATDPQGFVDMGVGAVDIRNLDQERVQKMHPVIQSIFDNYMQRMILEMDKTDEIYSVPFNEIDAQCIEEMSDTLENYFGLLSTAELLWIYIVITRMVARFYNTQFSNAFIRCIQRERQGNEDQAEKAAKQLKDLLGNDSSQQEETGPTDQ